MFGQCNKRRQTYRIDMKIRKIPSSTGYYLIGGAEEGVQANPIEYLRTGSIEMQMAVERQILLAKNLPFPIEIINDFLYKRAVEAWEKKLSEINSQKIPENFTALFYAKSKKEQIKLMKEQQITVHQLTALYIKSYTDYGFTYSHFNVEHLHNGLDNEKLPTLLHVDGDKIDKVGDSTLSDGQLKQLIQHRKVVIAKILDKGDEWHCFFMTYKSIGGQETWKGGQPHIHYISDKFGMTRERVVNSLKSKYYSLGKVPHIDLLGYRNNDSGSH